jgi:DNA-binding NarL/FixJ family response regulator
MSDDEKTVEKGAARPAVARVMLVDDHPVVLQGLAAIINYQPDMKVVAEATSVTVAVQKISADHPDIVIVDLSLSSVEDGIDLIKQARALHPQLAMIVFSTHSDATHVERSLRAGARGYVTKTDGPDILLKGIREILAGRLFVNESMRDILLKQYLGEGSTNRQTLNQKLTPREREVFKWLGTGISTRDIAEKMGLSDKTIETYREHIKTKLHLKNASELVYTAIKAAESGET